MGNFSIQQEKSRNTEERKRIRQDKLAGFFFDLAKLVFAGLVIGSITPIFTEKFQLINLAFFSVGAYGTYVIASFANKLLK